MHYSKFIEHLKNTRKFLRWTIDKEHALRACLLPHVRSALLSTSPEREQNLLYRSYGSLLANPFALACLTEGSPVFNPEGVWFTPVTAVCFSLTSKFYKSLDAAYAASEIDLDANTAISLEMASDDVNNSSEGSLLVDLLKPSKIP